MLKESLGGLKVKLGEEVKAQIEKIPDDSQRFILRCLALKLEDIMSPEIALNDPWFSDVFTQESLRLEKRKEELSLEDRKERVDVVRPTLKRGVPSPRKTKDSWGSCKSSSWGEVDLDVNWPSAEGS